MRVKRTLALLLVLIMALGIFASCKPDEDQPASGDTPLVVAIPDLSGKFSPFYATTAYDVEIYERTSIGVLTTDRVGGIIYNAIEGETVEYNGTPYTYTGPANVAVERNDDGTTTYTIQVRDDITFSDGHLMDADDLIFSLYVLSDKMYQGSSTIYSYGIIGMNQYRYNSSLADDVDVDAELADLDEVEQAYAAELIAQLMLDEYDWVVGIYDDESYASYTSLYEDPKDLFAYFYNADDSYDSAAVADASQVVADITAQYGYDWVAAGAAYGDATYLRADMREFVLVHTLENMGGEEVPNIAGIEKISQTEIRITTSNYEAPAVYSICGFAISPMHYYGSEDLYDYENNQFGFTREDLSIIEEKTEAPMGAGAYKFLRWENKIVYFEANELYYKGAPQTANLQYRETNDADMINAVQTGTVDVASPSGSKVRFESIREINGGELDGDIITTSSVDNRGYGYIGINANNVSVGGEPGSEASKNLRRAFATIYAVCRDTAIDTYYGDAASVINYPISNTSWAAPQQTDQNYRIAFSADVDGGDIYTGDMDQEAKEAAAVEAAIGFFIAAGYTFDEASGVFTAAPDGAKLEYEIIIPGDGAGDHPAFGILTDTRDLLDGIGITLAINDPADANVLWDSIEAGTQEMWTAAWQSTIDPDMYQIYYSTNAVGRGGTDSNHYAIDDSELDRLILEAREDDDQEFRKVTYKAALETIIDWAVEIPTYQRQNIVIFSSERLDLATVTPDITTYYDWTNEIENFILK